MSEEWVFPVVVLAIGGAALAYTGTLYTTGKQWYEGCYELKVEQEKVGWSEPKTTDAYKAAFWSTCESSSRRGIFAAGLLFSGNPEKDKGVADLGSSCPSSWRDVPMAGTYFLTIDLVKSKGGPSLVEKFLPAETMIGNAYAKRWPMCATERARLGFPKIIEVSPDAYGWATPCKRCANDVKVP